MSSYLLLRSNKESGPFTREELIANGLKPYDLVWLKGKSAAWRYPSEIDELKAFAPAVEEQPYDRFYKKEPEQPSPIESRKVIIPVEAEAKQAITIAKAEEQVAPIVKKVEPVYEIKESESAYLPKIVKEAEPVFQNGKKSVLVTMPGQRTQQAVVSEKQKPLSAIPTPTPIEDLEQPTISISETPVASKVKYSQPLDEIKEMYVKTLHERKTKIARKTVIMGYMKKTAVIAGLVGLGVLAGFIIKPKGEKVPVLANQSTSNNSAVLPVPDGQETDIKSETVTEPENNTVEADTKVKEQPRPIQSVLTEKKYLALRQGEPSVQRPELPLPKRNDSQLEENREFEQKQLFTGAEKNAVTGERTKTRRDNANVVSSTENSINNNAIEESNSDKGSFKVNKPAIGSAKIKSGLSELVNVRSNDYKIVAFGGIRDLRLTVTNNSKFELDNVVVELQYLKPSEQPLRIENIEFKFIGPNESSTIRVPDTNRGIKVAYKIISIGSKQNRDGVAGN